MMPVVAVRLGPGSGVEDPEAAGFGDQDMPPVARAVETDESVDRQVGDLFERGRVEDEDSAVVTEAETRCRTVPFRGWRRRIRGGARRLPGGVGIPACDECEGGCGEQRERTGQGCPW